MKIAFIDYVLEPDKPGRSGLSDVVWDMASELVKQGHEAHIIASYHTDRWPEPNVIVHNFPTPPIGYRNLIGQLWILRRAAWIVRQLKPDLIHAPEYVSTAVFAALNVRTPLILTVPGNVFHRLKYGHGYEWHYAQFLKWAATFSAKRCSKIVAISREMDEWWQITGSSPEKTIYIPLGVNINRFYPVVNAKEKLGLSSRKVIFLYLGRFSKEKSLLELLSVINQLKNLLREKRFLLLMLGEGPQKQELTTFIAANRLGSLISLKSWVPQSELPQWYSAADAVILPSNHEPLGRVILEAMACGTPVISTNSGGPGDLIIDGVNGFIYPSNELENLKRIIQRISKAPPRLRKMKSLTLSYARDQLSWEIIMQRVISDVYEPVLKNV